MACGVFRRTIQTNSRNIPSTRPVLPAMEIIEGRPLAELPKLFVPDLPFGASGIFDLWFSGESGFFSCSSAEGLSGAEAESLSA